MINDVLLEEEVHHFPLLTLQLCGLGTPFRPGRGRSAHQLPPQPGELAASVHDVSLDLLGGHDRQGRGGRERGPAEGDAEDHGTEKRHLLAELGRVLRPAASHQRALPHANPQGDS